MTHTQVTVVCSLYLVANIWAVAGYIKPGVVTFTMSVVTLIIAMALQAWSAWRSKA